MNYTYLKEDGSPDLQCLISAFTRCAPSIPGGLEWLDNVRFCRWPNQWSDGRKHDVPGDSTGAAQPWNGASDCRPFVVDDIINERVAMKSAAFWRAMLQHGSAQSEEGSYAVALAEHFIFTKLTAQLNKEVELSAQYQEHYGWCVIAPRWRREISLKRYTITMDGLAREAQTKPEADPLHQLLALIKDPSMEDEAVKWLQAFYDAYVQSQLPEDIQPRAPKTSAAQARKVVQALRDTGKATAPMPYLCKNEPEIPALKPWEEVFLPPELTDAQGMVIIAEWLSEPDLRGRIITEEYDPIWVEKAVEFKGPATGELPVGQLQGTRGLTGAAPQPMMANTLNTNEGLIRILHAVYRDVDEDGIPAVFMTTFHPQVTKDAMKGELFAKHGMADGVDGELPYVECVREWWTRAVTASRSVSDMAHTQQNLVKGVLDGIIDRQSITLLPPVNVYESPTGVKYQFGPAKQNFVRQGREPEFMQMPSGQGLSDAVETHNIIRRAVDNRFGLMSGDVPAPRLQTMQEHSVRSFLIAWTKALQQVLCLAQQKMEDKEFARITGAPEGWLEERRQQNGLLSCALEFDVRELDPELMMKRIESMNKIVLPNDVLGVVQRGKWTAMMTRSVLGPAMAKQLVQPLPDASQALFEKARLEVLNMFAGTAPNFLDKGDPTAAGLLQYTQQIVMNNPNYMRALSDEALLTLAGPQQAQTIIQQLGPRQPDERFSGLLVKWLENLKFLGVTQVQNRQTGRIGVNASEAGAAGVGGMSGGY